jgi:saccharopine dehydrogenase (NAD+, L-lysine forming)
VRVGACSETPIEVNGQAVIPLDFSVAHILSRRAALLAEAGIDGPGGCLKVVVSGIKSGKPHTFVLSLSAANAGAGEGTGIPAAVGAVLVGTGKVTMRGVFPPEAAVHPLEVMQLALGAATKLGLGGRDSIHIESIDAEGNVTELPLAL